MDSGVFQRIKRPERGADYPPASSARLRVGWSCTPASSLRLHRREMRWLFVVLKRSATSKMMSSLVKDKLTYWHSTECAYFYEFHATFQASATVPLRDWRLLYRARPVYVQYLATDVSGWHVRPLFNGQAFCLTARPLKIRPTGCPETSIPLYQPTPRNSPKKSEGLTSIMFRHEEGASTVTHKWFCYKRSVM